MRHNKVIIEIVIFFSIFQRTNGEDASNNENRKCEESAEAYQSLGTFLLTLLRESCRGRGGGRCTTVTGSGVLGRLFLGAGRNLGTILRLGFGSRCLGFAFFGSFRRSVLFLGVAGLPVLTELFLRWRCLGSRRWSRSWSTGGGGGRRRRRPWIRALRISVALFVPGFGTLVRREGPSTATRVRSPAIPEKGDMS